MKAWCYFSEDAARGKGQKSVSIWGNVHQMFHHYRVQNPEEQLGDRNKDLIKGHWQRLNTNARKWVDACKEAYGQKRSGMSQTTIDKDAHAIYEQGGCKYQDLIVFNEVMIKHPKRALNLHHDTTRFCPEDDGGNDESRGSSTQSTSTNEVAEEICALRLTRESELDVMNKLGNTKLDLEHQKLSRKSLKSKEILLNTLLVKEHLTPADEELKRRLMTIVFGD